MGKSSTWRQFIERKIGNLDERSHLVSPVVPEVDHKDYETLDAANDAVTERQRYVNENSMFQCISQFANGRGCGAWTKVKYATFIQTHFYISPHGCTGGDYWLPGEGRSNCGACGKEVRFYVSPEAGALKYFFKDIKDDYGENNG